MSFEVFTFYTTNTPYEAEAELLQQDCKRLNIPFRKAATTSTGRWVENTMLKPSIILSELLRAKDEFDCIVWVDADARINSYPQVFADYDKEGIDFSVFQMGSRSRITSGTIFMRNNSSVQNFLRDWCTECYMSEERLGDQHSLRSLIRKKGYERYNINYKALPYSYCYIFDDSLRLLSPEIPPLKSDPVIVHTQASRKYRNKKL